MKVLYIECAMGAAGDMLTAALTELMPDPDGFVAELNALGIPGVAFSAEKSVKCGITGTHMTVTVHGEEEESNDHHHHHEHEHEHHHDHEHEHDHHHDHDHGHHHHHSHSDLHGISHIVMDHLPVSRKVKSDVMAVYELIAQAESHAHGVPVTEIHFHEVGTMDAVADVTAVCLAMEKLGVDRVVVSPVHVGSGQVHCAHGILPVPAPATAYILRDVPMYSGNIRGELCTPTGAALLKHFASAFGQMPAMQVEKIGYGMGKKDFEAANCVRVFLGRTEDTADTVLELACNLDDMTPEAIGFAMEQLLTLGALDVWTTPIGMKKCRPGVMLSVLCRPEQEQEMTAALMKHTTTLGVRVSTHRRHTLQRSVKTVQTPDGDVTVKCASGYGVEKSKPEFEDLAAIARKTGKSLAEIAEILK